MIPGKYKGYTVVQSPNVANKLSNVIVCTIKKREDLHAYDLKKRIYLIRP